MQNLKYKVIYEDKDISVIDKSAGMITPPLAAHRLDKDTSGVLLIAKNNKTLDFLRKQFKERKVEKKYLALIVGNLKTDQGIIETLLGRSPKDRRKQKVCLPGEPGAEGKREAVTEYKVLERFKNYTLCEVQPRTGRKHQIRCHFAYLGHPIAGDKLYGFKNQPCPEGLTRQFLHANHLRVTLPSGEVKRFHCKLSKDLLNVIQYLIQKSKIKTQNDNEKSKKNSF